jgi:hypothetical protein
MFVMRPNHLQHFTFCEKSGGYFKDTAALRGGRNNHRQCNIVLYLKWHIWQFVQDLYIVLVNRARNGGGNIKKPRPEIAIDMTFNISLLLNITFLESGCFNHNTSAVYKGKH